jgi:zinc protease
MAQHPLVVSVLTKGQEANKAAEDNYTVSQSGYQAPDYGYANLKYNKAKDNFDRSKMPSNGANPVVKVPEFWRQSLPSDIKVIGSKTDEIPVVTVLIRLKGGKMMDANNPSKAGLSNMFAAMMEEDTKNYSAEAFSVALDKLGSSINIGASDDNIEISVHSLKKNLAATMALVEERLLRPNFTEEAFATNKKRVAESIKNSMVRPNYVASILYNKMMYGENNVLGWPSTGTEKTVNNIQLADVQDYYNKYISKKNAEVVIVGDVDQNEAIAQLAFLQQLPATNVELPKLPDAPKIEKTKIYFVNVPNAAQTEFRIGYVTGMKYDALGDYYKSTIMNYPLGGAFNSRLNLDLREDKGWTYGARSYFDGDKYTGSYDFSAGIKANATDSAMRDILKIVNEYKQKGITKEELVFTQNSISQSDARKYEVGYQKAGFLSRIMEYDLASDFSSKQNTILSKMTTKDINALASKYLPDADKMYVMLVGDKEKVLAGIQKLGYEVVELDKEGNLVK